MLDVDFLIERPTLDRPLVYLYRSGALRNTVRKAFDDAMKARGRTVDHFSPVGLAIALQGGGFFPPDAMFCDLDVESSTSTEAATLALSALAEHQEDNCAVFASHRNAITKASIWPVVASNALVLEETVVTADTLPNIIRYAQSETRLGLPADFLSQQSVIDAFDDLIGSRRAGFLEAKYRFIEVALTHLSQEGDVVTPAETDRARARRADEAGFRALRTLMDAPCETSARAFVIAIEERIRTGSTTQPAVARAYRWTERLLKSSTFPKQPISGGREPSASARAVLVWTGLLSTWEDRLRVSSQIRSFARRREPDMQMIEWHRLCREFLTRSHLADADDPLVDYWAKLRDRVSAATGKDQDVIAKNGREMLFALRVCLEPPEIAVASPWTARLHSLLQKLPDELEDE